MHRLAGVHVHVETNAISHDDRVGGNVAKIVSDQRGMQFRRSIHDRTPVGERSGFLDRRRFDIAMLR